EPVFGQLLSDEVIDGVFGPAFAGIRHRRTGWRNERPMFFVSASLRDPLFDQDDFLRLELLVFRSRRHDVIVGSLDAADDFGGLRAAFDDDGLAVVTDLKGELLAVESQGLFFRFASGRIGPVAFVTVLGKDWL